MQTNKLYILLISLAITGIVMLWDSSEEILTPTRDQADPEQFPYAVAQQAATRHFDDSGIIDYAFTADRLEHYRTEPTDDNQVAKEYTLIEQPHFTLYEQTSNKQPDHSQEPWHIQSDKGRLEPPSENITLWKNVRIWQTAQATQKSDDTSQAQSRRLSSTLDLQTSELSTSFLNINAHKKVAQTDEPVKIRSPYGVIDAVGMTANFSNRKIQLHKHVRAIHKIPPQAK